jgi:hypothetical protein
MEKLADHLRAPGRPTDQVFKAQGDRPASHLQLPPHIWRPAVADANLTGLRIHDLRHTSVSFVLDRYGDLFPEADTALRARLDSLFRAATEQRRNTAASNANRTPCA